MTLVSVLHNELRRDRLVVVRRRPNESRIITVNTYYTGREIPTGALLLHLGDDVEHSVWLLPDGEPAICRREWTELIDSGFMRIVRL